MNEMTMATSEKISPAEGEKMETASGKMEFVSGKVESAEGETLCEGRIEKALSGFYYVRTDSETLVCRARGKFRKTGQSPLVGDCVTVRRLTDGSGFVQTIQPRKNAFTRPAVANVGQVVMIASGAVPVTEPFLIDRMMSIAVLKSCAVLLVLNKCDLDPADELFQIYSVSGIPVLRVSALTGEGIPELARQVYRQLRRGEIRCSECAGLIFSPEDGNGKPCAWTWKTYDPAR